MCKFGSCMCENIIFQFYNNEYYEKLTLNGIFRICDPVKMIYY